MIGNCARRAATSNGRLDLADVLAEIAMTEGFAAGAVWIERGIVWRLDDEGELRSVCAVGTSDWFGHAGAAIGPPVTLMW